MNQTLRQGDPETGRVLSNQRARRLNAIRVEVATIARTAAEKMMVTWHCYACVCIEESIPQVLDHWIWWRQLTIGVFKECFQPSEEPRPSWWPRGHRSTRVIALLFFQRLIERASLDEVENWVQTYAPELLNIEGGRGA